MSEDFSLDAQVAAVKTEIEYRQRAYSHSVGSGKMTQRQYEAGVGVMCAVLRSLEHLQQLRSKSTTHSAALTASTSRLDS